MFTVRHLSMAAAFTAAAACACTASPARATTTCGEGTYAYAGFAERTAMSGVSATIQQDGPLAVHAGHVAGWIGVVDPNTGDAWLQVGLSALPGQATSAIYYEVAAPGHDPVYHQVATGIAANEPHTFAVVEQPSAPDRWVVWVDGRPAGPPMHLAGSRNWTAQVLGESWAGEQSGPCNAYSYGFAHVRLVSARGSAVPIAGRPIANAYYTVTNRTRSGFVASSFGVADFRGAAVEAPPAPPAPSSAPAAHD
jgi:hypothetical protein